MIGFEYRRQRAMTSGLRTGVTTYSAPARMAARQVSVSSTVPTPMQILSPSLAFTSEITWMALGVVMVTSIVGAPPATSASATFINCAEESARITAIMPGSRSFFIVFSFALIRPAVIAELRHHLKYSVASPIILLESLRLIRVIRDCNRYGTI